VSTTEDPTPVPALDPDERRAAAAALRELADLVALDDRFPVPTSIAVWSHQHGATVADVDVFVGRVDARRTGDTVAVVDDLGAIAPHHQLAPLAIMYGLSVYPQRPPRREAWSSQG
jgi:hypothetical protein